MCNCKKLWPRLTYVLFPIALMFTLLTILPAPVHAQQQYGFMYTPPSPQGCPPTTKDTPHPPKTPKGTFTTIGPPGWTNVYAYDINNNDVIVGSGIPATGEPPAGFTYHNGKYTMILTDFVPYAINDNGLMVGWKTLEGSGAIYDNGVQTLIDFPPCAVNNNGIVVGFTPGDPMGNRVYTYDYYHSGTGTVTLPALPFQGEFALFLSPGVINNHNEIIGYGVYIPATPLYLPSIYSGGGYTVLSPPDLDLTNGYAYGTAINDAGVVVGFVQNIGAEWAFTYDNGAWTKITCPGVDNLSPVGINGKSVIVGTADTAGFTYANGVYTTISAGANSYDTRPLAINDKGTVVGVYQK